MQTTPSATYDAHETHNTMSLRGISEQHLRATMLGPADGARINAGIARMCVGPWLDLAGLSERENSPRFRLTLCDWSLNSYSRLHRLHGQRRKCSDGRGRRFLVPSKRSRPPRPAKLFSLSMLASPGRSLGLQSLTSWPCRRTPRRHLWGTQGWRGGSQAFILAGGERYSQAHRLVLILSCQNADRYPKRAFRWGTRATARVGAPGTA
jgi:hypothetical protein